MATPAEINILLCVRCPALEKDVILKKKTWVYKIIPAHPKVKNKLDLVEKVILNCRSKDEIFQKLRSPRKISTQMQVSDFLPYNRYLRIAMHLKDDGTAIVTSVYPVNSFPKEGVKKYESSE